jgi:ferric iron reductase protein FhuF
VNATSRQLAINNASGASDDAPEAVAFSDLLVASTGSKYAYCQDGLLLRPKSGAQVVACHDLLDAEILTKLINRFSTQFEGADRRAIVSMWTLYYFSTLTIAVAVAGLELRRIVPASLEDMRLCIDPQTAAPQAFVLPGFGRETDELSIENVLHSVLRRHCEPLIEAIAANCGVGRRMLWNNVAAYLDWIVDEIQRTTGRQDIARETARYKVAIWSDGWKNPLHGLIRPECGENGEAYGRRKVCCLRYGLPGVGGCGLSCPLPQGRA